MKQLNVRAETTTGPMMNVIERRLPSAPCSSPCSRSLTRWVISPCAAGIDIFQSEMIGTEATCRARRCEPDRQRTCRRRRKIGRCKGCAFSPKRFTIRPVRAAEIAAGADANNHERHANGQLVPGVSIHGVKRPDAKNVVRGVGEKLNRGQSPKFMVRAQQNERADRIGPAQRERFAGRSRAIRERRNNPTASWLG